MLAKTTSLEIDGVTQKSNKSKKILLCIIDILKYYLKSIKMLCQLNISDKFRSLNFDERRKISFIIYHYTETDNLDEAIKLLTCKKRRVSCHFVIDTNGDVNLVDVNKRAWHAGESIWKRSNDINSRSIGIEIVVSWRKTKSKYSDSQILSIVKLTNILKKV